MMTTATQAKDYTNVAFDLFFEMTEKIEGVFLVNTIIACLTTFLCSMVMFNAGWSLLAIGGLATLLFAPALICSLFPYLRAKSVMELKAHAETLQAAFQASKALKEQGVDGLRKRGPWKVFLSTASILTSMKMNESLPMDIKDNILDAVKLCNPATFALAVRSVASGVAYGLICFSLVIFA